MAELHWTVDARRELFAVGAYISQDSPAYAAAFVRRLVEAVDRVERFPSLGRIVPEADNDSIREVLFQNYRVVYVVVGERVSILAVVHAAMDMGARIERLPGDLT